MECDVPGVTGLHASGAHAGALVLYPPPWPAATPAPQSQPAGSSEWLAVVAAAVAAPAPFVRARFAPSAVLPPAWKPVRPPGGVSPAPSSLALAQTGQCAHGDKELLLEESVYNSVRLGPIPAHSYLEFTPGERLGVSMASTMQFQFDKARQQASPPWPDARQPSSPTLSSTNGNGSSINGRAPSNGWPPPPPNTRNGLMGGSFWPTINGRGSSNGVAGRGPPANGAASGAVGGSTGGARSVDDINGWGSGWPQDWDPEESLNEQDLGTLADAAESTLRKRPGMTTPRDKWITPLLDLGAVTGAVDLDQERTEDTLQGEALANKDESQTAIKYGVQLLVIPLLAGFLVSRALADPVLNFTLQNNSEAFAMTDRQKIEGAGKVHIEEARLRFEMAIGKLPPLGEEAILEHLREFAEEVQEEERQANEQNLITVVSDSISSITLFTLISQQTRGRQALFNTLSRLFDGLSDIAKAVMIILIADTLLGYHSEEGWTGLIELVVGRYGFEAEEENLVIFVGIVPVVIDVFFKYWIFIGLNRISPGAVITLKQLKAARISQKVLKSTHPLHSKASLFFIWKLGWTSWLDS
ncbi:hypothetical protein QJQ45_020834 [Haematococcus lacustris]|nr:hypothetical protein QJQ45_020834 [Haematococcus lacustris]